MPRGRSTLGPVGRGHVSASSLPCPVFRPVGEEPPEAAVEPRLKAEQALEDVHDLAFPRLPPCLLLQFSHGSLG